jgi:hypothetical protein
MATDGKGAYREAMVETWGKVPAPSGQGRPPLHKQPQEGWRYLQVVKHRSGSQILEVEIEVIYGERDNLGGGRGPHLLRRAN